MKPKNLMKHILAIFVLSGCNHFFYYPDHLERMTPAKFELHYEDFYVLSQDGNKLHGWMIHNSEKKLPRATVVHFHGNAENMTSHFSFFAWLLDDGFDLVVFDYRGYGASEGRPTRKGLVDDGKAILSWVNEHARSKDLIIAAQSLGGAVAIPAIAKSPASSARIRAIILDSTFSSYRTIARKKVAQFWLTWPFQWPLSFLVSDGLSPIDSIRDVHIPLVFVHSPRDPAVPYALGRELYDAAHDPKTFWDVLWGGHTSAFLAEDDRYRQKLLDYLDFLLRKN